MTTWQKRVILPTVGALLLVAVTAFATLFVTYLTGHLRPKDRSGALRNAQLRVGMTVDHVKTQFGEPDNLEDGWNRDGTIEIDPDVKIFTLEQFYGTPSGASAPVVGESGTTSDGGTWRDGHVLGPYHVQILKYGPFGAHQQLGDYFSGHITKHRLTLHFVDGNLRKWHKSAPLNEE